MKLIDSNPFADVHHCKEMPHDVLIHKKVAGVWVISTLESTLYGLEVINNWKMGIRVPKIHICPYCGKTLDEKPAEAVKEELPFDDEPAENQDSAKWFTSGYAAPLKCDSPYLAAKVDRERQIEIAMMDISRIMRLTAAEADTLRDSLFSLIAAADNNAKTTQDLVDGLKASEGTAASSMGQARESWTGAKTSD